VRSFSAALFWKYVCGVGVGGCSRVCRCVRFSDTDIVDGMPRRDAQHHPREFVQKVLELKLLVGRKIYHVCWRQ